MNFDEDSSLLTRLTVIIPVWDAYVELLRPALAALKRSQGNRISIVVVDNASTVPVPEVGARVVRSDQRLTTGAARNLALSIVTTEFVNFLDVDDLLEPRALSYLVNYLIEDRSAVGAVASMVAYHPDHAQEYPLAFPTENAIAHQHSRVCLGTSTIVKNGIPVVGPAIWRTNEVRSAGGFSDANYCEDWGLAVALAFRGRIHISSEHAARIQFHAGSQISRLGRPKQMLRALVELHSRWAQDRSIPLAIRLLLPALALPRLLTIAKRAISGQVSHGDILSKMDNPVLTTPRH